MRRCADDVIVARALKRGHFKLWTSINFYHGQGIDFLQFAFRWVNCLLLREIPFELVPRLWVSEQHFLCFPCPSYRNFHWSPCFGQDTYFAEGDGMHDFLVYSCASLLLNWSDELKILKFQDLLMFLQCLPTSDWETSQVGQLQKQLIKAGTQWNVWITHCI
jgi:hypothetical protein